MQDAANFEIIEVVPGEPAEARSEPAFSDREALTLFRGIAVLPAEHDDLATAVRAGVRLVSAAIGWPVGQAWMREGRTSEYQSRAWFSTSRRRFSGLKRACRQSCIESVDAILARQAAPDQVLVLGDPGDPAPWSEAAERAGVSRMFAVPILADGEVAGFATFFAAPRHQHRAVADILHAFGKSLSAVASRDRMRNAVRVAARHARAQADQMEKLQTDLEDHSSRTGWLEQATGSGVWEWDRTADRFECTAGWRELLGLSGQHLGTSPSEWLERIHPEDRERVEIEMEEGLRRDDSSFTSMHRLRDADDGYRSVVAHGVGLRDAEGAVTHVLGVITVSEGDGLDFTPGMYDASTGLPTRELLSDRIGQAIRKRAREPESMFAVLMVSARPLDAEIPSSEVLSELRAALSRRLSLAVRPADTVAHARRGEFGLLLEGILSLEDAREIARRIHTGLEQPFPFADAEVRLKAHVGIVLGRSSYDDPESLLKDASVAMRQAEVRDADLQVFDFAAQEYADKVHQLEADLRRAIDFGELFFEYLPTVSLDSGRITGLEALIRWKHPEKGLIPPKVFVPVLTASPLVHDVGLWTVETACRQLKQWQERLPNVTPPPIAINITARQLFHEEFPSNVRRILRTYQVEGRSIRFDIAESELMQDAPRAADVLAGFLTSEIEVFIDDFGTGYSSLSLLRNFPAAALKIDRRFVSSQRDRADWVVARTIIELASVLGMEVIAEGVETRRQFLQLRELGCHQAQGFLFSGPVAANDAEGLIRNGYPLDLEAMREGRVKK